LRLSELSCDCDVIHAETVDMVKGRIPDEDILIDLSDFFKVLSDSTRMRIVCALDISEMCVCDLAVLLSMSKSAISHQLRALREANLVRTRRDGKIVFYSLADDHVKEIFEKGLDHVRDCDCDE